MSPSVTAVPRTTLASVATVSAAMPARRRPTPPARTNSSRPLSSSARVWRPMMNMLISPATIAPNAPACQATCPPIVSSARAGPAMAMNAVLSAMLAAASSSSACVAYSPFTEAACDTYSTQPPRIHQPSIQRSRRRNVRVRTPVRSAPSHGSSSGVVVISSP